MRSAFDIMIGDSFVSSFVAQGILAEQGTRRTYGSRDPSRHDLEHVDRRTAYVAVDGARIMTQSDAGVVPARWSPDAS